VSNKSLKKKQKGIKEASEAVSKAAITPTISTSQIESAIIDKLSRHFGASFEDATKDQIYKATAITVKDILLAKKREFKQANNKSGGKRVYYLCMEFLVGRSLKNNLYKTAFRKREKRRKIAAHARIFQAETAAEIKSQHA